MFKWMTMKRFIYFFVLFLLLTLSLFYWLNAISSRTLEDNLIQSSMNQLDYADSILDSVVAESSQAGMQYTVDNRVRLYDHDKKVLDNYDVQMNKNDIHDRMMESVLFSQSIDSLNIYWKTDGDFITTGHDSNIEKLLMDATSQGWQVIDGGLYYFSVSSIMKPSFKPSDIQYVVGIKLKTQALTDLLNKAVNSKSSNAFYLIGENLLTNGTTVEASIVEEVKRTVEANNQTIMKFDYHSKNGDYYILSKYSPEIDTYMVTYTRVSDFLVPLNRTRQVFFTGIAIIFLIGLVVIFTFYRNFYRSVYLLDKKFSQVEQGNYGTRIREGVNKEFDRLFRSFNHMVTQIQSLFSSLKLETELRKTAEFKQLQAQINPHFLYNSLFFIMSAARTSPDSVEQMSKHLAEYYRYNTKLDSREVTFGSELELAKHYLIIMSLCKELEYDIQLPETFETLPIIPLIIQPMVENAIQHGIEGRQGAHQVAIEVRQREEEVQIVIRDDGKGMNSEEIERLLRRIESEHAPAESRGIGLWNVNQRLKNEYGKASGLRFSPNDWGGLTVTAHIQLTQSEV
ncbi:two-component system sensor histidine kinase YesM [Paenibacillus cellulosilyticus]|uniref:Two-component system sensor histidine kinase YesM n=1 Tax=Paenibacillus cellulosilyticus TaxID=375489 RepID=A0A2V2YSH1_9BACL|nr:histidine kinase [Paenibacillus cellulosilyticus]PWW01119.1 two-component system sensor histidine kinase YesM [Paenibacillus cellulosilyticus]QKS46912.1 histidine kinase [Paenibacillus cellulosilyticus]